MSKTKVQKEEKEKRIKREVSKKSKKRKKNDKTKVQKKTRIITEKKTRTITKKTVQKTSKKTVQKWWRPTKYSREIVGKLTDIFMIDWTVQEACLQAGISKDTFYERYDNKEGFSDKFWEKEYERFRHEIDSARNYPFILAKKTLLTGAKTNPKYAIEFLKRRHKDYKDKAEVDNKHTFTWIEIDFNAGK